MRRAWAKWAVGMALAFGGGFAAPVAASTNTGHDGSFDLGPIISRHRDVNGEWRLKILGPLYEHASRDDGMNLHAVRPLYSTVRDPSRDRRMSDYLWPVGTRRRIQDESQWRWLVFMGFNHTTNDPGDRYRTWLIPFYFQGRTDSGKTYRALFPIGGSIHDFFGRDRISFVLFPLYSTSSLKDMSTVNFLWPLISRTRTDDDRVYRARFFPFYGVNREEGRFNKRFILWPFYTEVEYTHKNSKGRGHMVFPLYGTLNITTEKTLWLLPPFFRFTKGDERNIIHAPWPFYQRVTGKDIDLHYVWPFWGHRQTGSRERSFVLWPFFWSDADKRPGSRSHRLMAVPFFSHTVVRADPEPAVVEGQPESPSLARRHKVWPLYSYRREGEASRFRFVELWPFADAPSVDRNLAPLWTLYSRYANKGNVDTEILWGLYRNQKRAEHGRYVSLFPLFDYRRDDQVDQPRRSWNILKGLIGYEREGERHTYRFLYLLKVRTGKEPTP